MPKRPTSISNTISSKTSITFLETNAWSMVASKRAKVRYATSSWNLPPDIALLPNIPPYYIPSTTYAVLKGTTPQIVANSIVDVISRLSCVGEYNENQVSQFFLGWYTSCLSALFSTRSLTTKCCFLHCVLLLFRHVL
jgi:hypothetical protein